jgi:hypothetical protein
MARPKIEVFKVVAAAKGGNLSSIADHFEVSRSTVYEWVKNNEKFKQVVEDARGRLFDQCLTTSQVVAMGIPEREIGTNKIIGWRERPDGNMLRYLMSTLGRKEGFGESVEVNAKVEGEIKGTISIDEWIKDRIKK